MNSDEILQVAGRKYNRCDAMPLCKVCLNQPCQMQDIVWAAQQDGMSPEEFTLRYANELGLDGNNRFICATCKQKNNL
jgi:hypothetical protein